MTPKTIYKFVATGEAITWALLISALILRAAGDPVPVGVLLAGSIHGAMFLSYCAIAVIVGVNQRWRTGRIASAVGLAIVPFATIPFDRSLLKKHALEGEWRTSASDDPRDGHWFDKLYRWFIARPLILALAVVGFLAGLFALLLSLGSPTTWFN